MTPHDYFLQHIGDAAHLKVLSHSSKPIMTLRTVQWRLIRHISAQRSESLASATHPIQQHRPIKAPAPTIGSLAPVALKWPVMNLEDSTHPTAAAVKSIEILLDGSQETCQT
jgi:hypothetical protein